MTRRLSLLLANLLLLTAVIVMTYANISRAPHLCLSNLGADWQKTRIIRTHVILDTGAKMRSSFGADDSV